MAPKVNLDALILREDFEALADGEAGSKVGSELKLHELEDTSTNFHALRKPEYQRETSYWSPEKIVSFIEAFLDTDVIPAIILWRSPKTGNLFVIDGAHRLSALIAWINDDYGAGAVSRGKCKQVEKWQEAGHNATKALVEKRIRTYSDLKRYAKNPSAAPDERTLLRANNVGSNFLYVQSVVGDAQNAEKSYYAINQSATPIDETEFQMIYYRKKPNALAARALIRAGSGHKYWSKLPADCVHRIEDTSSDIYANLFLPILEYPIRTLDLPAAGHAYTAEGVKLIFDLVNYFNAVPSAYTRRPQIADHKKTKRKTKANAENEESRDDLPDDLTGAATLEYLSKVRKASICVFGPDDSSLGLHPGVYCYGATGRFHSQAFLGAIIFVSNLAKQKAFFEFTEHRAAFEEFLIEHRYFVNQITGKYGAGVKSAPWLAQYYEAVFSGMRNGLKGEALVLTVKSNGAFSFLHETTEDDRLHGKNFSKETRSAVYLREALEKELTCPICHAKKQQRATTFDHIKRKQDGGDGSPDNAQITHPYCNSGYKEAREHKQRRDHAAR